MKDTPDDRFGSRLPIVVLVGLVSCSSTVSAGVNAWTSNGPERVDVRALAVNPATPSTLYAGTDSGVIFKSTNGGASWAAQPGSLGPDTAITALAIEPSAPNDIYAATASYDYPNGAVFKSTDGGDHWIGSLFAAVSALVVDPSSPGTLYVGALFPGGVFKSTNAAGNWTLVNAGLKFIDRGVLAVAIDPTRPATLYASTSFGVFTSANGGELWSAINAGLTTTHVYSLAIDPSHSATVYAGTGDGGVFKSTNGGRSWIPINNGLTDRDVTVLAVDPANSAILYAGTYTAGIFRSTDAGGSWTPINSGLANLTVHELVIDPSTSRLYAATAGGVYEVDHYTEPCISDLTTLCLGGGGRFRVTTQWARGSGETGSGRAVSLGGGDAGYFTFFDPGSVEVVVKVLNGCSVNGSFWILAGGLTNVGVVLTVTDSQTGTVRSYTSPPGTPFRPIQDTTTFAACAAGATAGARPYGGSAHASMFPPGVAESIDAGATGSCVANATTLCLSEARYEVRTQWVTRDGRRGAGQVIPLTGDTGAFWFFSSSNVEVVVKMLNGCAVNSRHWAFAGGLTDVEVILTVTDTQTGAIQTYTNPPDTPFQPIQDTSAFSSCP